MARSGTNPMDPGSSSGSSGSGAGSSRPPGRPPGTFINRERGGEIVPSGSLEPDSRIIRTGYVSTPSQININVVSNPNTYIQTLNPVIKEINFVAEKLDLKPFLDLLVAIKNMLVQADGKVCLKDECRDELVQLIGNELVGESYYRWNSRVEFYPTLVFIFLENKTSFEARRKIDNLAIQKKTQIKIRVTQFEESSINSENIQSLINDYRTKVTKLEGYSYKAGNVRCTYVSPGKARWKTSIFAPGKNEACRVLGKLCIIIGEVFDPNAISTTVPRIRESEVKTKKSVPTEVILLKVSLLIKTLGKPIMLYHS